MAPAVILFGMVYPIVEESNQYYIRRTIVTGASVFAVSMLAGIAFRCWHEYRTPILRPFTVSELLFVSTVGPLAGAVLAWPLTLPVLIACAIMVSFGSRMCKRLIYARSSCEVS